MEKLHAEINQTIESFQANSIDAIKGGNKAAARRSRKDSLDIARLLKEWRKKSVEVVG